MDRRAFRLGEHVSFDCRRKLLGIFARRGLERKGIDWVAQISFVGADSPQVIPDLYSLVGAQIPVDLGTRSQKKVKIFGQDDPTAVLSCAWQKPVEPLWRMKR